MSTLSEKQLAANRLNALRSTGPRTPEGKRISSQNARLPEISGRLAFLPPEKREAYQAFLRQFLADLQPVGILEGHLTATICDLTWQMNEQLALTEEILQKIHLNESLSHPRYRLDRSNVESCHKHFARLQKALHSAAGELRREQAFRAKHSHAAHASPSAPPAESPETHTPPIENGFDLEASWAWQHQAALEDAFWLEQEEPDEKKPHEPLPKAA